MNNAANYFLENDDFFKMNFICRFLSFYDHIDSMMMKGKQGNVSYIKIDLDYCITVEAEAWNCTDNIKLVLFFSSGKDSTASAKLKLMFTDILQSHSAVLVTSSDYTLIDNEIVLHNPTVKLLGFPFE